MLQTVIVVLLVTGSALYAAWALLPGAARRGVALALLKRPLPAFAARFLRRHAEASSGCGCDGCDHRVVAPRPAAPGDGVPLVFHPRRKR